MHLQLLGAVQVAAPDGTIRGIGSPKQRSLLAALALHPGEVVPLQRLIDELWGQDPPASCEATLQSHAAGLRRRLGDVPLRASREGGYVLDIERGRIDAHRFEDVSAAGHAAHARGRPHEAAHQLRQALRLWHGEALADVPDGPEARAARARLTERYLEAVEARVAADLAAGRHAELVGELEALVIAHPYRERLWAHLMRALYRAGRQGDALASFQRASRQLVEGLGVDPGEELTHLQQQILRQDPELGTPAGDAPAEGASARVAPGEGASARVAPGEGAPAAGGAPATTVAAPALAGFRLPASREEPVGRDDDVAALRAWLDTSRLVTLTGPGGAGKTTLALHVARQLEPAAADGAVLIELAHVEDPRDVGTAAMAALGAEDHAHDASAASVARALGDREVLVVLDNCEHVLGAAAELVDVVLSACRGVQVLATSRHALEVPGEQRWPVPPLSVPAEDADPGEVVASPAVSLLRRRARAADPAFDVAPEDAPTAARIVAELDGIPLAIELVAVRVATMSLDEIVAHLTDRFRLLRGGPRTAAARHQTLEAALAWSEQLLDDHERAVLMRLAVLPGGADRVTASRVVFEPGTDQLALADVLDGLVRKSLLHTERTGGRVRYRMLETVRAYFLQRLEADAGAADVRRRLAEELLELSEAAGRAVRTRDPEGVLSRLDDEEANLAAVRSWALEDGDPTLLFRLVTHLPLVAELRVRPLLYDVMETAADAAERSDHPEWPAVAAATAVSRAVRGDAPRAREQLRLALERLPAGHPLRPVAGLFRVHVAAMAGETDAGVQAAHTAVAESRAVGDGFLETFARSALALVLAAAGRREEARAQVAGLRGLLAEQDSDSLAAWCAYVEGEALGDDHPEQATDHFHRAIDLGRRSGADAVTGVALIGLSSLEGRHGASERALPVFAEALGHHLRGSRWQMCWEALLNLTEVLSRLGEHAAALEICGAAEQSPTCSPNYGETAARQRAVVARAEEVLGADAARRARQRGAGRSDAGAVRAALATIGRLQARGRAPSAGTVSGMSAQQRSAWKVS